MKRIPSFVFLWTSLTGVSISCANDTDPIPGFEQILDRGLIASIDEPDFVTASEAEIGDEDWVMGIVVDGEARAYSLNLLNSHEIVNDNVSGTPVAAVW